MADWLIFGLSEFYFPENSDFQQNIGEAKLFGRQRGYKLLSYGRADCKQHPRNLFDINSVEPLTKDCRFGLFWLGAVGAGLILPAIIRAQASKKGKKSRSKTIADSVLSLVGSLALKWAVINGGRDSAENVEAVRRTSLPIGSKSGLTSF